MPHSGFVLERSDRSRISRTSAPRACHLPAVGRCALGDLPLCSVAQAAEVSSRIPPQSAAQSAKSASWDPSVCCGGLPPIGRRTPLPSTAGGLYGATDRKGGRSERLGT